MAKKQATANIVGSLPEEKRKEIAVEICRHYDIDIEARSDWEEKRNRWYKLWACIRDEKNEPWPGASNICIPMLATAINQFHGRSYQAIFAPPGMVKCLPVSQNDIERAKNVESFLNYQTMYDMEEYEDVFDRLLQQLPLNGTAFKKLSWDSELERPVSEYCSALDIVLPYSTRSLATARRITHRLWLHYDEMLSRKDRGIYDKDAFELVNDTPGKEDDSELADTAKDATGITASQQGEKPHMVLECHRNYTLGGKSIPMIFTVDYDSQTLLRATSREIKSNDGEMKTLNHFTDYHFIRNPEGYYSYGFGHFLEPLNEMANTAFNQIFDSGRLTNQPFGFYGRRAGIKAKTMKIKPGMMYEVEDAKEVYFPNMQRVDQTLFMVLGQIQQYVEQFTSTSDYMSGRESKGTKTPTAHGTLAIIEQGLVTFAVMTKRIFRSLRTELRLIFDMNALYMPDSKEYMIMGNEQDIPFPDINRKDFNSKYHIIPIGDPSYASKQLRREEAQQLYSMLMSNPLIVGMPPDAEGKTAVPPNIEAMHAVTSDLIESYDRKNKGRFLPDLPKKPITPQEENAKFMQGDYNSPLPGEGHQGHLDTHMNFKMGAFYAGMPDDYRELLEKHIQETVVLMYKEQENQAMMVEGMGGY